MGERMAGLLHQNTGIAAEHRHIGMSTNRRTFLQHLMVAAAGWGVPWSKLVGQGAAYRQALAGSLPKRALLIGINHYPHRDDITLQGCHQDLELQRELLIARFRFSPADVVTLVDEQATPSQIQSALQTHLGSASNGVGLIHFSGYGRFIQDPGTAQPDPPPSERPSSEDPDPLPGAIAPALMLVSNDLHTIEHLLLSDFCHQLNALNLSQLTAVLDCGLAYSAPLKRGNSQLRSQPALLDSGSPNVDFPEFMGAPTDPALPSLNSGILLAATTTYELAAETIWPGFKAGIFSYLLTQYLWETTATTTLRTLFNGVTTQRELGTLPCQKPSIWAQESADLDSLPYYLPAASEGLTGVVQEVRGNRAQVWLGGLPPAVLRSWHSGSILTSPTDERVSLVVRSWDGLKAQAYLADSNGSMPPVGTLLRESVRVLPAHLNLAVGLDDSLGRIEKVDITSAVAALGWADPVNPYEHTVDCIIGRMTPALAERLQRANPALSLSVDSYGLFWPGRDIVQDTFGSVGEAAKSAIQRLRPRLEHLWAVKRLRSTLNAGVSAVPTRLQVSINSGEQTQVTLQAQTLLAMKAELPQLSTQGLQQLSTNDHLTIEVFNESYRDLHAYLLVVDGSGQLNLLWLPGQAKPITLSPQSTFTIPSVSSGALSHWSGADSIVCHTPGLTEMILVVSATPLLRSFEGIKALTSDFGYTPAPLSLSQPGEWVQLLMDDVTQFGSDGDSRYFSHNDLVTLSVSCLVI